MSDILDTCGADNCKKPLKSEFYCSMHQARLDRTGRLTLKTLREKLIENSKTNKNGCWEWVKYKNQDGYGRIRVNGKKKLAHRASFEEFVCNIPEGMIVCHRCDNPSCIKPEHLFLGTHKDNCHDAITKGRVDPEKRAKERWIKCPTLRKS